MKRTSVLFLAIFIVISTPLLVQSQQWVQYTKSNSGLLSDTISAIAFDNSGNTWIGSYTEGLAKFDGSQWTTFTDYTKVPSNNINAIVFCRGSIWVATAQGLAQFDGSTWKTYTIDNSQLADNTVNCLLPDNSGNLWIGTGSGLNVLTPGNTWKTFDEDNVPTFHDTHIAALALGLNGKIWVSFMSTYGMVEMNLDGSDSRAVDETTLEGFPNDHFLSMVTDASGNTWGATFYQGIVKINGSNFTIYSTTKTPGFISDDGHAVAIDRCGHVWIGTSGGAAMLDGSNWVKFSIANSPLQNDTVLTIAVDNPGHVWLGTAHGITEYKPLPEQVTLISPPTTTTVNVDPQTFQWNWDCPGILKYWFEVADNAAFSNSRIDTTSASLTQSATHRDTSLLNRTTYYWRVKAKNDAGWGPFSATWSFTYIMPLPSQPTLVAPPNGTTIRKDSVTCTWTMATPHVQKYWYELSDNPAFSPSIVDTISSPEAGSTNHWNSSLLDHKTYYWRVKASNVEGWGPFSDTWSFIYNSTAGVTRSTSFDCDLAIFPNPAQGNVTVQFSLPKREAFEVSVYDECGALVQPPLKGVLNAGRYALPLSITSLHANGAYRVLLTSEDIKESTLLQIVR